MNLPKKVRVGGMTYKVQPMSREMHDGRGDEPIVGLCDKCACIIYVWLDQSSQKLWSTLWHEVRHASVEESAIDLRGFDEEDLVAHLERIDWQVFRDNPTMMNNIIKVARE